MKIYNNNINKIKTYSAEAQSKRKIKKSSQLDSVERSNVDKTDKISLSKGAVEFTKFKEILSSLPDVRNDKVAELQASIQNGTYHVESEEVADKLLEDILMMNKVE